MHTRTLQVRYTIATDKELKNVVISGDTYTSGSVDFTLKLDMSPLKPSTKYYYAFSACNGTVFSMVGQTKTAPRKYSSSLPFVGLSCSYHASVYVPHITLCLQHASHTSYRIAAPAVVCIRTQVNVPLLTQSHSS